MLRLAQLFVLLAVLATFSFAKSSEKLPLPEKLQARELPWFAMRTKDSEGIYNSVINRDKLKNIVEQRNSKRIIFAFFATWCVPCREGLKIMSKNSEKLKKKDILVVLVSVGEKDYNKVDNFAKEYIKKEWLLGFDMNSNIPEKFGLLEQDNKIQFPKTLLLDSNLVPLMLIGEEGDDFLQILCGDL